jgi:hypothetical protein
MFLFFDARPYRQFEITLHRSFSSLFDTLVLSRNRCCSLGPICPGVACLNLVPIHLAVLVLKGHPYIQTTTGRRAGFCVRPHNSGVQRIYGFDDRGETHEMTGARESFYF